MKKTLPLKLTVLSVLVAVRVFIPIVPPRFKVELTPWIKVPVPVKSVVTDNVLLLVSDIPVIVTFEMDKDPKRDCGLALKV